MMDDQRTKQIDRWLLAGWSNREILEQIRVQHHFLGTRRMVLGIRGQRGRAGNAKMREWVTGWLQDGLKLSEMSVLLGRRVNAQLVATLRKQLGLKRVHRYDPNPVTREKWRVVRELREKGLKFQEIADIMGVSRQNAHAIYRYQGNHKKFKREHEQKSHQLETNHLGNAR